MSYRKTILIFCLGIFLSAERDAKAQVVTASYNYVSNAVQQWTVPCGVTSITVQMWGAGGGGGNYYTDGGPDAGASGAYYEGVLTGIGPGNVLNLYVPAGGGDGNDDNYGCCGNAGAGGWPGGGNGGADNNYVEYGGGGGGYAGIEINGTYYVVAGAGGGGGAYAYSSANGGAGGATTGGNGANGISGPGGTGGTISAGGVKGYSFNGCDPGGDGTLLAGGVGGGMTCSNGYGGGGGGAGYYGGGGGGDYSSGGGGGSSFPSGVFSSGGITFTPISNIVGNSGSNSATYPAPGSPPAGIGQGGWESGGGGNGLIILSYDTGYIPTTATANIIANETCSGDNQGEASITVTGGSPAFMMFTWTPSGGTGDTATGLFAGSYTVTVVNPCGGTASAQVIITQPSFFAANPIVNNIPCYGGVGSIYANITGGTAPFTYMWSPEGTTADNITGLSVGTYSLNVADNHGCKTSSLISITQPTPLVLTTALNAAVVCNGQSNGSASSNVEGGSYPYGYVWSPSGLTTANISNVPSANYTLTLTDANGCVQTSTVDVSQPAPLDVIAAPLLNLACNGDNNGVLGSGVTGGTRPYVYSWSTGSADSNASNLSAGTYSLTVTDAHGCVTNVANTVTQPALLAITMDSTGDGGNCTGSAWVTLSGGTTPYNYMWSNGNTTFYSDGLCHGKYCCTVTDANGCIIDVCADVYSDLGVANISADAGKITVYPNPSSGQFSIESSVSGRALVDVYNVLGEKVFTANLDAIQGINTVNISNQPNGVYLYRVMSESGSLLGEGKVILQK